MHTYSNPVVRSLVGIFVGLLFCLTANAKEVAESLHDADQLISKGEVNEAVGVLTTAIQQTPESSVLHLRLAELLLRGRDFQSAEREALIARKLKAEDTAYLPVLAEALLQQEKFEELVRLVPPGQRDRSIESKLRVALGIAELGLGHPAKAEEHLRQAVQLDGTPKAKTTLARLLAARSSSEAEQLVDEAIAVAPKAADSLELKGELLQNRGDRSGAMRLFDEARKIAPDYLAARLSRARLNVELEQFDAADEDLKIVLRAIPNQAEANYLFAYSLAKRGQTNRAYEQVQWLTTEFDKFPAGYYLQAVLSLARKQYPQAQVSLSKYSALVPNDPRAPRLAAVIALRSGHPDDAIAHLDRLGQMRPLGADELELLGNAYTAEGNADLALQQFDKAAALAPENRQIQGDAAISAIRAGKDQQGLEKLERLFDDQSGTDAALVGPTLVLTQLSARNLDKASQAAEALVAKDAKSALYQTLLGLVKTTQRNYPEAERSFERAIELTPNDFSTVEHLAQLYLLQNRKNDALAVYDKFLVHQPQNVDALLHRADLLVAQKDWLRAINDLNTARNLAPNNPAPTLNLIALHLLQKNLRDAQFLSANLAAQFPNNTEVLVMQARVQALAGDQTSALTTYKRAYQMAPDAPGALSGYEQLLIAMKDLSTAEAVLDTAVMRAPNDVQLKIDLIRLVATSKGLDAAADKARTFAGIDPARGVYEVAAAELYDSAGHRQEAMALLDDAASRPLLDAEGLIRIAGMYRRIGEMGKAERILNVGLTRTPDDRKLGAALASIYLEVGNVDGAISQYSLMVTKGDQDVVTLNNLASAYQQKGDLKKARQFAEESVATSPHTPQAEDTLGWILLAQGETDRAVSYLNSAIKSAPTELEIQYHLAVALHRLGHISEAEQVLDNLLRSKGSFSSRDAAEKLLQELRRG